MPSWQWKKPSFSWQGPSPAYSFRLHLSNTPGFPTDHIPKCPYVLWGFCPQQTSEVPRWQWLSRMSHCPGEGLCPISSPSTDGASKAFTSCCGLGAPQCTRRARREQTVSLCLPALLQGHPGERTARSPQHVQGCLLTAGWAPAGQRSAPVCPS